jgi:hypothetical protein
MSDDNDGEVLEFGRRSSVFDAMRRAAPQAEKEDADEDACPAFGYLRGVRDRGLHLELRFRTGNRDFLPYSWLGPFYYNPSAGVLLRFSGDTVILVLIQGSNLDLPVRENAVNLTDRGLQRHRVTFIREMDEEEVRKAGEREPTIDRIVVAEFETQDEAKAWLKKTAPAFVR